MRRSCPGRRWRPRAGRAREEPARAHGPGGREAFPIPQARLNEADWEAVEALAPSADDPCFGVADPQRFRSLFQRLSAETQD